MTEKTKHWAAMSVERIRELIDKKIYEAEIKILEKSHILKHSHLFNTDGGSEINNIADFQNEKNFLNKIQNYINDLVKDYIEEDMTAYEKYENYIAGKRSN